MKWPIKLFSCCMLYCVYFKLSLTFESSFGATYCMRGFLTYLSQSLGAERNANRIGMRSICVEIYFIFHGNILYVLGDIFQILLKYIVYFMENICLNQWIGICHLGRQDGKASVWKYHARRAYPLLLQAI